MSKKTIVPPLETFRKATRKAAEPIIELVAKIEHAADLEPGTFLEMHMEWLTKEKPEDLLFFIEGSYDMADASPDWRENVTKAVTGGRKSPRSRKA